MGDAADKIWKIVHQVRSGKKISFQDFDFTKSCILEARDGLIIANACEVIICSDAPEAWRKLALAALAKLCEEDLDDAWVVTILNTINYLNSSEILSFPIFKNFSYYCSHSNRWEIRCNAIPVIAKFYQMGDTDAEKLLQLLLIDNNKYVNENAAHYLG